MKDLLDSMASRGRAVLDDDSAYARYQALPPEARRLADRLAQSGRAALDDDSVYGEYQRLTAANATAPATRPAPQRTGSPAVDFFLSGRRDVGRPTGGRDMEVAEALLPRASKAYYDDPSRFGRRAAGAVLDVASLPGRVASAVFAPTDTTKTFAEQVANTGSPENVSAVRRVAHEIVTDPANAFLVGEVPLGAKALSALGRVASKAPAGTRAVEALSMLASKPGTAMRVARSAGRGARDVGLPIGSVTAASDYANGEDAGNAMLSGLESGALASSFGPAADATRVAVRAVAGSKPVRAIVEKLKGMPNPLYQDPGIAVDVAKAEGRPLSYTGLRTAPTLGEAASDFANSDALQFMREPAFTTAKKLLREQVKPAPAAKKGMEVEDFITALNTPGMFDELTRYRDIVGGVGGFGKRNLGRIDEMNKKTWGPLFNRYEDLRRNYNEALKATDYWDTPELRGLYEYLGSKVPEDMARQISGVPSKDVAARAIQLADETIRNRDFGGDPRKLAQALRDQIRIYATPADATIASHEIDPNKLSELPIGLAHRAKSQQFQSAYASGVPDDMTSARQYAANLVGKAHNDIVDQLINTIEQRTRRAQVLPSPMLRPNKEEAEFAQNLFEGNDPVTEAMREFGLNQTEGPIYDLQRKYFGGGEMPTPKAATDAILQDAANRNLLESRRADVLATSADREFADRVRQTADELEADYNELRDATNRRRRPGMPQMPAKPREAFEREARDQFTTDDFDRYSGEIMDPAAQRADQTVGSVVDDWRSQVVEPWLAKWSPYREAQQGVSQALARTRKLDAALQPWYKAEAGLQRAANTGGNRYSLKPADAILPIIGAGVGAGIDKLNGGDDSVADGTAIGAAVGLSPLMMSRLLRTPAGPKLLRDVGRAVSDATTGVGRNVGATASTSALAELLSTLPTDWAERLRTRKYNDAPVDSTSEGRLAEKKGDRK